MHPLRLSCLGLLLFALACGENNGEAFAGCGDIATQYGPSEPCATADCSFDPPVIDCQTACGNLVAVCAEGCGAGAGCTRSLGMEGCLQACDIAPTDSCGNATFGCYTLNESCSSISLCLACGR